LLTFGLYDEIYEARSGVMQFAVVAIGGVFPIILGIFCCSGRQTAAYNQLGCAHQFHVLSCITFWRTKYPCSLFHV